MNLHDELNRLTEPPIVAGAVRMLSTEEIERLRSTGAVTPLESVPVSRMLPKVSYSWQR